jgi:hypothetical protein
MYSAMKLLDFKNKNNLTYSGLAKLLEIKGTNPTATVRKWCLGERIPRSSNIINIQNKTGSKVKPQDFYG